MGIRFRKSKKIGPVRVTVSKSGVGYSVGAKGLRVTQKADGGTRTTMSIPGTGISDVKESGKSSERKNISEEKQEKTDNKGCCYIAILFPIFIVICFFIATISIPLALIVGIAFIIAAYCFFITRQGKEKIEDDKPALIPEISQEENETIKTCVFELKESADIVNSTVNPNVFFGRLKFLIETLMYLQKYEGRYNFGSSTPTEDLNRVTDNIELTVSDFIKRAYQHNLKSAAKLKTEKGRHERMMRNYGEMKSSFDKASSFWNGDNFRPSYGGILYTENNSEELQQIYEKPIDWSGLL